MEAEPYLCQAEILHQTLSDILDIQDRQKPASTESEGVVADSATSVAQQSSLRELLS